MKVVRYLHCLLDDKFIDGAISLFDSDTCINNDYVLFQSNSNCAIQRIKNPKASKDSINNFFNRVVEYDVVILHDLKCLPLEIIAKIPKPIKVVWLMWGFDFYNNQICDINLYHDVTCNSQFFRLKLGYIRDKVMLWYNGKRLYENALNRVDYFSGVFPYEYNILKHLKNYPDIKAKPLDFYYGSTDFFIPENPSLELNNNHRNIIIGNSADLCNNALDVFEIIEDVLNVSDIDHIIVPLSYGGNPEYISKVKKSGISKWKNRFKPLDKFLPLDEYLLLISNCKSAIYFHERQQASDNVFLQLMYGARVFMSETSLMFQYLKKQGYKLYSLQKDLSLINEPLPYEEVMVNRRLLSENYSSSKLIERVIKMNHEILRDISSHNLYA